MEREKQREKERQSRQQQVSENNVKDKKELFGSPVKVKRLVWLYIIQFTFSVVSYLRSFPGRLNFVGNVLVYIYIYLRLFLSFFRRAWWCRLAGRPDIAKDLEMNFFSLSSPRRRKQAIYFYIFSSFCRVSSYPRFHRRGNV